jgi:hypothetical protein
MMRGGDGKIAADAEVASAPLTGPHAPKHAPTTTHKRKIAEQNCMVFIPGDGILARMFATETANGFTTRN